MSPQRAGLVTGLVSFRTADVPAFHADVQGFNLSIDTQPIVRTKRGDVWRRIRQSTPGAGLILTGEVRYQGFPLPDQFKGVTGSVDLKYHQSAKATCAIRVMSSTLGIASKTAQDTWDVTFTCEVTAMPVLSGFGAGTGGTTQVANTAGTPAYDAAETHEGVGKAVDPDGLQDLDTVRYDLDGLLDTHADETSKVLALIAAQAATRTAMKIRSAAFQRTDAWGGVVVITLSRTTTAEDAINAATDLLIDPKGLTSSAATAGFNTDPSPPTTPPYTGGQWVSRGVTSKEFNDGHVLKTRQDGVRSTQADLEYPNSPKTTDASSVPVDHKSAVAVVTTSETPPAAPTAPNGVLAYSETTRQDDGHYLHIFRYAPSTPQQEIEFDGTQTDVDPNGIEGQDKFTYVTVSSTPPNTPTPSPSTLKLRRRVSQPIRGTPAAWKHVFSFDVLDSKDERAFARYKDYDDPNNIEDSAVRYKWWDTSGSAPSAPDDPPTINVKVIGHDDVKVTDTLRLRVWLYGPKDSRDEKILPNTSDDVDPEGLESTGFRAYLDGDATPDPPEDLVYRRLRVVPITDGLGTDRFLYVQEFGVRSTKQDIEYLQSRSTAETGNVKKDEIVVKVLATATPVTDNTYNPDTTNLEFWTDEVHRVTATLYVHVITYKPLSPLNEAQEDGKQIIDDPVTLLIADDQRRVIDANGMTAAPVVAAVNGQAMVCTRRLTKKKGHTLYQHDFWYAFRSVGDQLKADKTQTMQDVGALRHEAVTADVWTVASGEPVDPSAPSTPTGLKLVNKRDLEIANPLYRLRVYLWGLQTSKDEIEQRETVSLYSATEPPRIATASVVSYSGTAAALAASLRTSNANASPTTFDGVEVRKLNDSLALQKIVETPNYLIYEINSFSGRQTVNAFLVGGAVYVRLNRIIQRCSGLYDVLIAPQTRIVRRSTIVIRRKEIGDPLDLRIAKQGLVNSDGFLGHPIGEVLYRGPRGITDLAITGGRGADMGHVFEFCSLGWYSEEGVITGWFPTTADLSDKEDGDTVTAATFGWDQAVGTAATPFIGFITP